MTRTIERLQSEFMEMPGLRLTVSQVQRLCGIEPSLCQPVLDALVELRFLRRNADGTYARSGDPVVPRATPARVVDSARQKRGAA